MQQQQQRIKEIHQGNRSHETTTLQLVGWKGEGVGREKRRGRWVGMWKKYRDEGEHKEWSEKGRR